jgi:hypothetical protein
MSEQTKLDNWIAEVSTNMPHLSKPQAIVLGIWSFGMVMTQSCGLTSVASFLATLLGEKENSLRQRLREWYWEEEKKRGTQRTEIDVSTSFVPLIRWIIKLWPMEEKRLALVMDPSTLGEKFTVLVISIVYRGCAIPIAWKIVQAATAGSWEDHWLKLLEQTKEGIPSGWLVVVMADRGLYAKWLYKAVQENGWHPFFRIKKGGTFRVKGNYSFRPLSKFVSKVGMSWIGEGTCFKTNPLNCTLLARWDEGHEEPWLIITDLMPEQADAFWYSMRAWIECGFKHTKRGGWQWQKTRMTDHDRASRLWLAIAVATLWVVSVGGEAEMNLPASSFDKLPDNHTARQYSPNSQPRLISCFRRGIFVIISALINGHPLPLGRFFPLPWPTPPSGFT